jgi:hypothetical protein
MSAQIIKTEIDTDPLTRGYSGMSDQGRFAVVGIPDKTYRPGRTRIEDK